MAQAPRMLGIALSVLCASCSDRVATRSVHAGGAASSHDADAATAPDASASFGNTIDAGLDPQLAPVTTVPPNQPLGSDFTAAEIGGYKLGAPLATGADAPAKTSDTQLVSRGV